MTTLCNALSVLEQKEGRTEEINVITLCNLLSILEQNEGRTEEMNVITLCDVLSILEQNEGSKGRTGETQRKPGVGDSIALRLVAKNDKCSRKQKRNRREGET